MMRFKSLPGCCLMCAILAVTIPEAFSNEHYRYHEITNLHSGNLIFRQYQEDVLSAQMAIAAGKLPTLHIYRYRVRPSDTLFGIAARCSIPYDAIASLNRIESAATDLTDRILFLPSIPALYLPEQAENRLEQLVLSSFDPDTPGIVTFTLHTPQNGPRTVHCIPNSRFDGTVRAFFLTPTFRFPLPEGTVTSTFGMRKNPLTGNMVFHHGVDLAAPAGTVVLACADGIVEAVGYDDVYGQYIIIRHAGNRESLYGHLLHIKIELHDEVKSGTIIGNVGSTGQSTGPHLHFEVHENGVPKNPAGFLKRN